MAGILGKGEGEKDLRKIRNFWGKPLLRILEMGGFDFFKINEVI
jgi:hypothetical protein